jgi:predicted amidophosphoribosyltransferase
MSPAAERPDAQRHFETIAVQKELVPAKEILLVDDVVTSGAALLGSANRLFETYPDVPIRGSPP